MSSQLRRVEFDIMLCIYIYICMYVHVYVYIYIYICICTKVVRMLLLICIHSRIYVALGHRSCRGLLRKNGGLSGYPLPGFANAMRLKAKTRSPSTVLGCRGVGV